MTSVRQLKHKNADIDDDYLNAKTDYTTILFQASVFNQQCRACHTLEKDGAQTDIVVLACTHYPFLVNRMRKTAPWPVDWIDPAEAIARRALSLLPVQQPASAPVPPSDRADVAIFTSGKAEFTTRRLMQGFGLTVF